MITYQDSYNDYLKLKRIKKIFFKKKRILRKIYFFKKKFIFFFSPFRKNNYPFYHKLKNNYMFWSLPNYQIYEHNFDYFLKLLCNFKLLVLLRYYFLKTLYFFSLLKFFFIKYKYFLALMFFDYIKIYKLFFNTFFLDLYFFYKYLSYKNYSATYFFFFTFNSTKLFINVKDTLERNFFFLSNGFLIKFFNNKKSFKKNKLLRFLLIKFLRKVVILTKIKKIYFFIKKNPVLFNELIRVFHQRILHQFYDPFRKKLIRDPGRQYFSSTFFFFFRRTHSFVKNKIRKPGRVKRKIFRKIIFKNRLVD